VRLSLKALKAGVDEWKAILSGDFGSAKELDKTFLSKLADLGTLIGVEIDASINGPIKTPDGGSQGGKGGGGGGGGFGGGNTGADNPGLVDQSSQGAGHRASGGNVLAGVKYLTAEHGQGELFVPQTNGYIYNAGDTAQILKSLGISTSNDNSTMATIQDIQNRVDTAGSNIYNTSNTVQHRASGGVANAGQRYMVGEHGNAELFVPYTDNSTATNQFASNIRRNTMTFGTANNFSSERANSLSMMRSNVSTNNTTTAQGDASTTANYNNAVGGDMRSAVNNYAYNTSGNDYTYNSGDAAALTTSTTHRIELVVSGESNLPHDRASLRELSILLAREMNLSGAVLTMN
jgi:hypothetical protein